jgi:hypothetical protein
LLREHDRGPGPATQFLASRRTESFLVTVISVGELAVLFDTNHVGDFREQTELAVALQEEPRLLTVIGERLKQSGVQYPVRGANDIIALRCRIL